jgi:hypothetical protein
MKLKLEQMSLVKMMAMAYAAGYVEARSESKLDYDPVAVYHRLSLATVNGYCPCGFDEVCRMARDIWQHEVDLERKEKEQKND